MYQQKAGKKRPLANVNIDVNSACFKIFKICKHFVKINTFVMPQGCAQYVLVRNTQSRHNYVCYKKSPQGTFKYVII